MWAPPLPVPPMRRQPPPGSASRRPAVPQRRGTASCRPAGRAMLHLVAAAAAAQRLPAAAAVPHDCLAAAEAPTLLKHWSLLATAAPLPTWQRSTNNLSQAPDKHVHVACSHQLPESMPMSEGKHRYLAREQGSLCVEAGPLLLGAAPLLSFAVAARPLRGRLPHLLQPLQVYTRKFRQLLKPHKSVSASWILGILLTCTGTTRHHMVLAAV